VPRIALCVGGGGVTGAMFQIGALAALEDAVEGFDANGLDLYFGAASGATVAAALAGGRPVQRLYRALLDPADDYFPLERRHLLRGDASEWRRAIAAGFDAMQHGARSLFRKGPPQSAAALWEQLDRFYDTLPSGVYSLDGYERFLEDFFVRRGVPNNYAAMPRQLRVLAHELDSGEATVFGRSGLDHVPVTRTCVASMALPPFFSPVRIGEQYYFDAGAAQATILDAAVEEGAEVILMLNAQVPVVSEVVPTGHGRRKSVRDKGLLWVSNQAGRIACQRAIGETVARVRQRVAARIILIEPEATDGILFLHNPASFAARRDILEYAYRTTRARASRWLSQGSETMDFAGWRVRGPASMLPPAVP
jgi:NTE family protein